MEPHTTSRIHTPRRKRLKIASACLRCHRRKVKCDGIRPACGACQRSYNRADCIYENGAGAREASLARVPDDSRAAPQAAKDYAYPGQRGGLRASTAPERTVPSAASPLQLDRSPSELHGEDPMSGVIGDPARTREVYGSSSAGSFIRQIQTAINSRLGIAHQVTGEQKAIPRSRFPCPQTSFSTRDEPTLFLLPPRGLADGLIGAYWDSNWALYPAINRRKIVAIYDALWTSPTSVNYPLIPMSIVNLCFAIGCHYSNLLPPKNAWPLAMIFMAARNALGEAIRMAQSLGVHLCESTVSLETVEDREYKRRIWHCCVWLDRVLSSTLGRPGMIPKWLFNSVPLPSMMTNGQPCIMAGAVKALELYQILDEVLVDLYLKSSDPEDTERRLMQILEIDSKPQIWNRSLPEHLQFITTAKRDFLMERQATVLRARFLRARILLFRPALISYCIRGGSTSGTELFDANDFSLAEAMLTECSRICFRVAQELIEIYDRRLSRQSALGPLPNWWYSVLYVYNATMMILDGITKEPKAYQAWHAALRVLRCYSVVADSAKRCVAVLEILCEKLSLDQPEAFSQPQQNEISQDWDSPLAMSNPFAGDDAGVLPFRFDDFIWSDAMPAGGMLTGAPIEPPM
ncbi:hypothetical protein BDV11DRAFT_206398 [Aspergillus similis]